MGYGHCTLPSPFLRIRGTQDDAARGRPAHGRDRRRQPDEPARSHNGTKTLTFSAADAESGVERVDVLLDGIVVASDVHRP